MTKSANATQVHRIYRQVIKSKQARKLRKQWEAAIIIGLMLASAGLTGVFFGSLKPPVVVSAIDKPVASGSQDLNGMIDDAVNACYYDAYQQNDTLHNADICNKVMMSYKELCKTVSMDVCQSEFFTKYLRGMEG